MNPSSFGTRITTIIEHLCFMDTPDMNHHNHWTSMHHGYSKLQINCSLVHCLKSSDYWLKKNTHNFLDNHSICPSYYLHTSLKCGFSFLFLNFAVVAHVSTICLSWGKFCRADPAHIFNPAYLIFQCRVWNSLHNIIISTNTFPHRHRWFTWNLCRLLKDGAKVYLFDGIKMCMENYKRITLEQGCEWWWVHRLNPHRIRRVEVITYWRSQKISLWQECILIARWAWWELGIKWTGDDWVSAGSNCMIIEWWQRCWFRRLVWVDKVAIHRYSGRFLWCVDNRLVV